MRSYLCTHAGKVLVIASRTSNAFGSVFFRAMRRWKIPRIGSSWFSARIASLALGMMADKNLAHPGTFPLVSQMVGVRGGGISVLKFSGKGLVGFASRSADKIWKT